MEEVKERKGTKLGELIRNRRIELELSQREVADGVGISLGTYSRYETGDIEVFGTDKLVALSETLKLPVKRILGVEDLGLLEEDISQITDALRKSTSEQLEQIYKICEMNDLISKILKDADKKDIEDLRKITEIIVK